MLKSSLCDYSDVYILVKRSITTTGAGADAASSEADERNKGVIIKNCALFINSKSKIDNTEINRQCSRYWYSNANVSFDRI